jgi:hypothetical protein
MGEHATSAPPFLVDGGPGVHAWLEQAREPAHGCAKGARRIPFAVRRN